MLLFLVVTVYQYQVEQYHLVGQVQEVLVRIKLQHLSEMAVLVLLQIMEISMPQQVEHQEA
jgi:hypothetical protein